MIRNFRFFFLYLFSLFINVSFANSEIDIILNRHKSFLLKVETDEVDIKNILNNFNKAQKRWNNIDYYDAQKAQWKVAEHLKNIKALAVSWSRSQSFWHKNHEVYNVIVSGLDNWAQNKYRNPNWWHNEIGVPQLMRDILVLMKDGLSFEQINDYLPILGQYRIAGTGANLIWSSDVGLFYGLFTKDFNLIDSAVSAIINEIKISDKEGIRPDFSFHQHGARLQMYQYGAAFLLDNIRIAWTLQKSRWAYSSEKTEILISMLLDGWQWMARGIYTVPETMDRSSSRVDELNKADVRLYIDFFRDLLPSKADELNALNARQNNVGKSLDGFRHFPYSDFTAYHNRNFSFFLKTISSRTLPSESINNENLKGKLLNSGETYFMRDGEEYFNMMPVWNWEKIPGITSFAGAERMDRKDFNGSISDGKTGLVSLDYTLIGKDANSNISCKKSWFVYKNYVLCLISDMRMKNVSQAYTILDQTRWRSSITTNKGVPAKNKKSMEKLKWAEHNGFIYFPLTVNNYLQLHADTVSGSWNAINRGYSKEKITDKVFMPFMLHQPEDSSANYVVAFSGKIHPNKVITNHPFNVIRNDAVCQGVIFNNKKAAIVFYKSGSINLGKKAVYVDKPCLLIVGKKEVLISDPLHKGGIINITYKKKKYQVNLPSDGTRVSFLI